MDLIREAKRITRTSTGYPGVVREKGSVVYTKDYPGYQSGVSGKDRTGNSVWYAPGEDPATIVYCSGYCAVIRKSDGSEMLTEAVHRLLPT